MRAKEQWNEIHKKTGDSSQIQEGMEDIVRTFKKRGVKRVLDLACGAGKYTVYLAEHGFEVYGIDISEGGVRIAKGKLKERGLSARLQSGSFFKRLPYDDDFFDAVICIRSINHGRIKEIQGVIREIERVLRHRGFIFITVRKKAQKKRRHPFKEIAPHTYIPLSGREEGIVHYLFTKASLRREFGNFKVEVWLDSKGDYYCLLGKLKNSPEKK